MLNQVVLIGRLTDSPELRYTPNGVAIAKFTLAVERPFKSQSGEREVDFIDIVVWRRQAELAANHLDKGRLVAVEGRLQVRSYDVQDGSKRKAYEVVADSIQYLDKPKDGQAQQPEQEQGYSGSYEDDLPF